MKLYLRSTNWTIKRTELAALCMGKESESYFCLRSGISYKISPADARELQNELNQFINYQIFDPPKPQTQGTEDSKVDKVLNKYIEIFRRLAESNLVNGTGTQSENVFGIRAEVYRRCAEALEGELKKADSE